MKTDSLETPISDIERWRHHVLVKGRRAGVEQEVLDSYEEYLESGDEPSEAARCALWDWDV